MGTELPKPQGLKPSHSAPHVMLYLGLRRGQAGAKRYAWVMLPEAGAPIPERERESWFKGQLQKNAIPGALFRMFGTPDGSSITLNKGQYLGRYHDTKLVAEWQATSRATGLEIDLEKKTGRELRERLDLKRLEPIRTAYIYASGTRRALILAAVVKFIVSG